MPDSGPPPAKPTPDAILMADDSFDIRDLHSDLLVEVRSNPSPNLPVVLTLHGYDTSTKKHVLFGVLVTGALMDRMVRAYDKANFLRKPATVESRLAALEGVAADHENLIWQLRHEAAKVRTNA